MTLVTLDSDIEQHYLQFEGDTTPVLVEEPIGWKESSKEIKRSKDSEEIITKNAKDVKFIKKGREYILEIERVYGMNAKIRYSILKENPLDSMDFYKDVYFLDLKSYKDKGGILSIKIDEGGLAKVIKSKKSQNLEFDRITDLKGSDIDPLKTKVLNLTGKNILLTSLIQGSSSETVKTTIESQANNFYTRKIPFPLNVISNNDKEHIFAPIVSYQENPVSPNSLFYVLSNRDRTLDLKIENGSFWINPVNIHHPRGSNNFIRLELITYQNGSNFDFKELEVLFEDDVPGNSTRRKRTFSLNKKINLLEGESLGLIFHCGAATGGLGFWGNSQGRFNHDFEDCQVDISLKEDSSVNSSFTKVVQIPELLDKQLEIITGIKGLFYSDLFGRVESGYASDGEFKGLTISNGLWIRGFEEKDDKRPSLSLKDLTDSLSAVCSCSPMIEKIGFKERYRLESVDFFYVPQVTLELPNIVEDLEISPSVDFMYGGYEFGFEKGGDDYEEATGIGEYNGKAQYSNVFDMLEEKTLVNLSKIRGDGSMVEFARRKRKETHPQEDTKYDLDNVFIDTIDLPTGTLRERKWEDDLESIPSGLYDPENATNLRFTPATIRNRKKLFLASSLFQYPESYLRFVSSNCNSNLKTKKSGEIELDERGDYQVKYLGKSKFKMYWATFTHKVSYDISKKLRSKVIIDNEEKYVFYGLVKFRTSETVFQYGYIFEVKEDGEGKWKVLLANK